MNLIAHRRNTVAQLRETPTSQGVEIDLRSANGRLLLAHDPFVDGEDFETWLEAYRHGTLILNVKEEGLEERVLETLARRGVDDFFFLDQSFPFLVRWARRGERRCAVRVSEFESIDTALTLGDLVDWVWVDCFTRFPLEAADARRLAESGLRLCLVSPELQGRDAESGIPRLAALLRERGIVPDAVCSKRCDLWETA